MGNVLYDFFDWIASFFKKPKRVNVLLDPKSVKDNHQINALVNENVQLKAKLSKIDSENSQLRESKEDDEEKEKVSLELNERKKEIQKKYRVGYFSLKGFFKKLEKKPFKDKVGIYTFGRDKKIGKFGDIVFSDDGDIALVDDKNRIIIKRRDLNSIFQSVGGLGNDVKTFKMPINLDKEGNPVENIMMYQMADITPGKEEGEYKYTIARKKPLYKLLSEKEDEISEAKDEIEILETTNNRLDKENKDLKSALKIANNSIEMKSVQLSNIVKEVSATEGVIGNIMKELSISREVASVNQETMDQLNKTISELRDKVDSKEERTKLGEALNLIAKVRTTIGVDDEKDEMKPPVVINVPESTPQGTTIRKIRR